MTDKAGTSPDSSEGKQDQIGLAFINDDLAKVSWVLVAGVQPFIR
jgi:hypothetical protein